MSRVAGFYARVSTARQEDQETIDSQLSELRSRIKVDGCELPIENEFIDDGWTGTTLERPGLDAMRDGAGSGQFEVLYVYDRGRLSRMYAYQEIIIEELANKQIEFVTLHDVSAKTPEEHVLQAMQGVFHEYERVKIAERFRRGKLHKARNGVLINGGALYGYTYVKKTDDTPAHYEINEDEASIVKKIFEWVGMERLSVYEVKKRLFDQGIMPRKRKRDIWSNGTIRRLLRNEAYLTGVIHYNKSEAVVTKNRTKIEKYHKVKKGSRIVRAKDEWIPHQVMPILIDNGLFEKVQTILDYYSKYQPKNKKYDYLLSGLVWCECGQRRVGDGYSGNHYYRCVDRIKSMPMPAVCKAQGVNAVLTDGFLWTNLEKFLSNKDQMREQAKKWLMLENMRGSADQSEKEKLTNQVKSIEEEKLRYTKAYGSGTIEEEQLKVLLRELEKKMQSLQTKIKVLDTTIISRVVDDGMVDKLCDESMVVLKAQTQGEKKKLIQDIIDKVTFYDEGVVQVAGHIPQFAQNMAYGTERRDCRVTKCGQEHAV
ncbi:MAG: recombinase family protein [bacterium]